MDLEEIASEARRRLDAVRSLEDLRVVEGDLFGKASPIAAVKRGLGRLEPDERRAAGRALNALNDEMRARVGEVRAGLEDDERAMRYEVERIDLTEVGADPAPGHLHLVTQVMERLEDVFVGMGWTIAEGPEADTDWNNFEALNFPPHHPARDMYDTFYLDLGDPGQIMLRTHTSPVQVRVMETTEPPIYIAAPGRCARSDTADATHLPVFFQIEGLVVDHGITMRDLKGTLDSFIAALLGTRISTRLRPFHFPFTEPSAEFDITCIFCEGAGCRTCSKSGFIELGGCGMVHPNVFAACGIDPEEWTGFAFGFGIDRLALMYAGVDDMREFTTNDVRFLSQF